MSYKIPLFNLNYGKREEHAILRVLRSKWISTGLGVDLLEREFAKYLNIKHAIAVTNCTAALHLALRILGIKKGNEVIVPSLTFVATVNAVRYVGAVPVFADITGYNDFSIDPADIEKKVTSRTKAIIVMHYGGFSCGMKKIMRLSKKYNLFVVEDAAHAPGSEYQDKKLGTIGHVGCFSFFSNKNITCAEGGMLVTNNNKYAQEARLLRSHGMTTLSYTRAKGLASRYEVVKLGFNYRMDDIRGALALAQFRKLKTDIRRRGELRKFYIKEISGFNGVIIPYQGYLCKSSNYIFPVLLKNSNIQKRARIRQQLAEAGIQTSVHYPAAHRFFIYKKFRSSLPKTDYVTDNEITLPLFFNLSRKQIQYIAMELKKALDENNSNNR